LLAKESLCNKTKDLKLNSKEEYGHYFVITNYKSNICYITEPYCLARTKIEKELLNDYINNVMVKDCF